MLSEELIFRRRALMGQKQSKIAYEAWNLSFDGVDGYIDTGVYLFTQENINRNFEFIAEGIYGPSKTNSTIICAKHDGNASGFLIRTNNNTSIAYYGTIGVEANTSSTVIVRRINGVMTLSGTNITNPRVPFINNVFNWSLHLGCAIDNNGSRYRYAKGTIDHLLVRWL